MREMSESTKAVLLTILERGPITGAELRLLLPDVHVTTALATLQTHKLIGSQRGAHAAFYEATREGARRVRPQPGSGVVGGSRHQPADGYTTPKPGAERPGAQDAYRCPSRRGDLRAEYRAPWLLASRVQGTRFP